MTMGSIDDVKAKLNIVDVIAERVTLKRAGRHLKGLCPFHNEKTPSFIVSPERQSFKCFGCGKGGSVIDFVMEYEHLDFLDALEELAQRAGVTLDRGSWETEESKLKKKLYEVNHLSSEFYHYLLTKHDLGARARSYIESRGVSDKVTKSFMLGYSPKSWDGLLKFLRKKGYSEEIMEKAGLVIRTQGGRRYYDRFRGRLMFTLKDHRGNVVGFSGRILDGDKDEAKYINTSETAIYSKSQVLYGLDLTKNAIQKENEAVVMEGEFDVISSFQAGIGNVVAIKGSALTEGHVDLLRRFCEKVILALDTDVAGDAAARRGIEIAERAGLDIRVAVWTGGKDPDDMAREQPAILKKAIAEAIAVYDYFLTSALSRYDKTTAFGKKKITDEILPQLVKIENPIVQNHYLRQLAQTIDTTEDALISGIKKSKSRTPLNSQFSQKPSENASPKEAKSRREKLELYILSLLLAGETIKLFRDLQETMGISNFNSGAIRQILTALDRYLGSLQDNFMIKNFVEKIPSELWPALDNAYLADMEDLSGDQEKFNKEWVKSLKALKRDVLKDKIRTVSAALSDGTAGEKERQDLHGYMTDLSELSKSDNT